MPVGGHRHRALETGAVRLARHFGGSSPKDPPKNDPVPLKTDPSVEEAARTRRALEQRRKGRRATMLAGNDLAEPATQRGSLTAPGSVQRLGG